jgi:hypothetical protein
MSNELLELHPGLKVRLAAISAAGVDGAPPF